MPPTVLVTTEQRFARLPSGACYVQGNETYSFFSRYLASFEHVSVLARTVPANKVPAGAVHVTGPGVSVCDLPDFHGALGSAAAALRVLRTATGPLARAVIGSSLCVLREPGAVSTLTWLVCLLRNHPYGVELVNDPVEIFSSQAMGSWYAPLLKPLSRQITRATLARAVCASYVTRRYLQERYPVASGCSHSYSSVELPDNVLELGRRHAESVAEVATARLIFVGRLSRPFKGLDILLRALSTLRTLSWELTVVGGGALLNTYRREAVELGIAERVRFCGDVPAGDAVTNMLLSADLFILPSRREGLPRALIEAMGAGLACLATDVGGTRELLAPPFLLEPENVQQLAAAISALLRDPQQMRTAAARNVNIANDFTTSVLNRRRQDFYKALADAVVVRARA